ncbi:MAG: ATP-binding protein [Pseudomonadota bacterium]
MRFVPRRITGELARAARAFPALILTGPRRCGKTTLLRRMFPGAGYALLEDPDVLARVRADPRGFLGELRPPVILDEIQNAPELLGYIRTRIDAAPRRRGQWLLTGSQEAPLMRGVTESMTGRAAVLHLMPLSLAESPRVSILLGGFPEALSRPADAQLWFRSYVQTYLERDVRAATSIRDLAAFRRFLGLLAARTGQVLNRTDIAGPLGVSVPTVGHWLSILELTGQILVVPPYHASFGKRLIKSPKIYIADPGLACHLLGVETRGELERSPFRGALFEGFVAAEIAKAQLARGRRRELYHFRDQQGLEVDFLVPDGGALLLVEAKATRTPVPAMAAPLLRLARAVRGREARCLIVHAEGAPTAAGGILAPGVRAVALGEAARAEFAWKGMGGPA